MPTASVVWDNIETIHENENHNETFWSQVELSDEQYKNVKFPTAFWSGWYDLFSSESIVAFDGYNTKSDPSVRYTSTFTMDACGHCSSAGAYFTQDAVQGRTAVIIAQMFATYGIRPVARTEIKNVTFYVMSSNDTAGLSAGQYWTSLDTWPAPKMTKFFLHPGGSLSNLPPAPMESPKSTTYIYDPNNYQPTAGGNNLPPEIGGDIPCGPMDQGTIDQRSDVIVFDTAPLSADLPLTGPMFATLYVASNVVDTDFMVRISDVYPTGEVRLLMDNALRMRWREGGYTPVYITSGEIYKIDLNLWNTSYIWATGHQVRVAISSSNNPRFSVNPNNGLLLADPAYPGENITATNSIYHSAEYPSYVTLPVVSKLQLPKVHVVKETQKAYPNIITEESMPRLTEIVNKIGSRRNKANKI